jgi:hypothetical protein
MKNERYRGQIPVEQLQKDYILHFNPNYWMHKANALLSFIENPAMINTLKFEGDKDTDEVIIYNLKLELHMTVFHSSETLFLNIFSMIFKPDFPWIWISRCKSKKLYNLIETVGKDGLSKLASTSGLRENLYPSIGPKHTNYEKTVVSAAFVVDYLDTLANEYLDHNEYNSYKHGLRSFVGRQKLQAIDDQTNELVAHMEGDIIQFLEFQDTDMKGNQFIDEDRQAYVLVKLATKGFDYKRELYDYQNEFSHFN